MKRLWVHVVTIFHHKSLHWITISYNIIIILSWYQIIVLTALHPQISSSKMTDDQEYLILFPMIMKNAFVSMVSLWITINSIAKKKSSSYSPRPFNLCAYYIQSDWRLVYIISIYVSSSLKNYIEAKQVFRQYQSFFTLNKSTQFLC